MLRRKHANEVNGDRDGAKRKKGVFWRRGYCDTYVESSSSVSYLPTPDAGKTTLLDWGIPSTACGGFQSLGISKLYEWQDECLRAILGSAVASAIYSAPTSGGKSLVADIVLFRRLFYLGRRALVVCPFVSICRERAHFLRTLLSPLGMVVEEFHGSTSRAWHPGVDVAVCTVQKATGILHGLVSTFSSLIGTVVVDEFHLVFQARAGMESFVTRLGLLPDRADILMVGLSATLPGGSDSQILRWLNSHAETSVFYSSQFRPIQLNVFVKRGNSLVGIGDRSIREIEPLSSRSDADSFSALCAESLRKNISTIVFCATRHWCENAAQLIARALPQGPIDPGRLGLVEALRLISPCGVHPVLESALVAGVGFHHAGLTSEERSVIELGFRAKNILLLCATSTLSAGVNLPAERVVLRTLSAAAGGGEVREASAVSAKLRQMVGRAGRAGLAKIGEAIVCCQSEKEERVVREIFFDGRQNPPDASFSINPPDISSTRQTGKELLEIATFFGHRHLSFFRTEFACKKLFPPPIHAALEYLLSSKLAAVVEDQLIPTAVGDALAHSPLPPEEAETVFAELSLARQRLCLSGGELHLLFLVAPPMKITDAEFENFSSQNGFNLHPEVRAILDAAGGAILARKKRVLVALILRDLIREPNIATVAARHCVPSGTVQFLQANASTHCGIVTAFCERLQWASLAAALNTLKPKLLFGVPSELAELIELEGVSPARAKALAAEGFGTLEKIAHATPLNLAIALTRDVTVEGTQMTTNAAAQKLVAVTCTLMIDDARLRLGLERNGERSLESVDPTAANSTDSISIYPELFPPLTPPVEHQLGLAGLSLSVNPPFPPSVDLPPSSISSSLLGQVLSDIPSPLPVAPLSASLNDDILLALLRSPPPRDTRRISEMTTIDAKRHTDEFSCEFGLPPNTTRLEEDEIEFSASLFQAIGQ